MIPTSGETAPNVWYRIHLRVTDSLGRTHTTMRDVFPHLARLGIQTNPPGMIVRLDAQPVRAPYVFDSVVGMVRTLEAPNQELGGIEYAFAGWSDGGGQLHAIATPATPTAYVAQFQPVHADPPPAPSARLSAWRPISGSSSMARRSRSTSSASNNDLTMT